VLIRRRNQYLPRFTHFGTAIIEVREFLAAGYRVTAPMAAGVFLEKEIKCSKCTSMRGAP
jgi:hypothetical protein